MAKTNSLKVAPYEPYRITHWEYDESLKPDREDINGYYWDSPEYQSYLDTRKEVIDFNGETLMEYTSGKPGEQTYVGGWSHSDHISWRPNEPFEATLTIRRLERGRSAARFWFEDETNKIYYPFFGQTLVDMLSVSEMKNGKVTGTWIVVKKGSNYGIELYQP